MNTTGSMSGEGSTLLRGRARDAWAAPVLVSMLASIVVLPRLGAFGLWADEGFSVSTSLRPWGDLVRLSVEKETNGVLYALFLKLWAAGGTSEAWLRLPSAWSFISTAVLTLMLGRRLHGSTAGALAGVAVCVHGSLLQYGQNIRYYAPVTAVAVAFALCCHHWLERRSSVRTAAVVVLGVCLPLLHLVAGTLLVGMAVVFWLTRSRIRVIGAAAMLFPGALALAAVAVLVSSRNEGQSINQPLGVAAVMDVVYTLTGSNGLLGATAYGLLGLLSFVILRSSVDQRVERGGHSVDVLFPWILMTVSLVLVCVGSVFTTLMVGRYVLFLVPFVVLALAIGVTDLVQELFARPALFGVPMVQRRLGGVVLPASGPQPWSATRLLSTGGLVVALAIGAIGAVSGAVNWTLRADAEEWRTLSSSLLAEGTSDDAVLFANDSIRLFVEYQLLQHPEELASAPEPLFPSQPWGQYRTGDQQYVPFEAADVERALLTHDRVWLVVERPLVEAQVAGLLDTLRVQTPTVNRPFGRAGTLYRFDRLTN